MHGGHVLQLELLLISLHVDQRLIQIEYEQFIEAGLFKSEIDFLDFADHWEVFYLLDHVDSLEYLHRDFLVD